MDMLRSQRVSNVLNLIADIVEHADVYLSEELQATRRSCLERLIRRTREKAAPLTRDVLRTRRERKARSRYASLKGVISPPRKILSTRFRFR